jgi:predicted dehydrogenase
VAEGRACLSDAGISDHPARYGRRVTPGDPIALVGCGEWGSLVLRDLRQLGCTVWVVARSEESRARALAGGASAVVDDADRLPADVAAAVVAAPTPARPAIVRGLLARGVSVFTEKPLADDAAEARQLAALGGPLFVMDKWRYHPAIGALARLAGQGTLGQVRRLHCVRLGWRGSGHDRNPVWTLLPHDLSIAQEVLGGLPEARCAEAAVVGGVAVELRAVLGGQGGPQLVVEVSSRQLPALRRTVLTCDDGVAVFDGSLPGQVTVVHHRDLDRAAPTTETLVAAGEPPLLAELRAFLEYLSGEGPAPRSTAQEAAEVAVVVDALLRLGGAGPQAPPNR